MKLFLRLKIRVLLFVFCCLSISSLKAQEACYPFQDGEEIVYIVYYNWGFVWVPAGEVKFSVTERDSTICFDVIGKSFSSYDNVFKVRDFYSSEVDNKTFLPKTFRRDVEEGKYIRFDSITFDQKAGKVVEYFGKTRERAKKFEFEVEKAVHDMVSIIYQVRSIPIQTMQAEEKIPVSFFFDKELFNLNIKFSGKKTKKIKDLGKVDAFLLQPELIDSYVFSEGDLMDIWVSDDDNRIPLMIESPISVGSVKAVLRSAKGLKEQKQYVEEY